MANAANYYGNVEFNNNQALGLVLENTYSPSNGIAGKMVYNQNNNKPQYYNGTSWQNFDGTIDTPMPENTYFVSPNFNGIAPFFNTINDAINNSDDNYNIIVFAGTYNESVDMSKRHFYFHPNSRVIGECTMDYSSNQCSIEGYGSFYSLSGIALHITDSADSEETHSLEFDSASNLVLDTWSGKVKCREIKYGLLSILGGPTDPMIYKTISIEAPYIEDINISSYLTKVFINTNYINKSINVIAGDVEVEFKRFGNDTSNGYKVNVEGISSSKIAKLKLIDGSLPENWDNLTPVIVGDYSKVILQHVWIKNAHREAIFLNGSIRNSHLLKVDNCILIANAAIDATLTSQDVYCFGSWGQNNVTSNIVMRTEPLNIGVIW